MGDITLLITRANAGEPGALDHLFEILYPELRRIAHRRLHRTANEVMLQTTALVNECFIKLSSANRLTAQDRSHFLAYSAHAMRSIIVDAVRASKAERRGGEASHQPLDTDLLDRLAAPEDQILAVHEALQALAKVDERLARVVEMRYFGGMDDVEIGAALDLSERTVRRDWEKARLLLAHEIRG